MTAIRPLRHRLLIGASLAAITLTGAAGAENFGARQIGPGAQAAQATRAAVARVSTMAATAQRTRVALEQASRLRAQMDAAQAAARAAAQAAQSTVANGLAAGGLQQASGVAQDAALWIGAKNPTQSQGSGGRTNVTVDQTQDKAILTWDSFNVGRETDLLFDHHGNSNWITLNRVTDVGADASRILGSLRAAGSVYILNRNGVLFGGSSTVNVRNLIAASAGITNEQFLDYGIHSRMVPGQNSWDPLVMVPSFTGAKGAVTVEAGAQIATTKATSVIESGGYVMLLGSEVENAGRITTTRGQTILSAGDDFLIRAGYGTDLNQASTTRGQEIAVTVGADSTAGRVVNSGVIEAQQGDITLAGQQVVQDGIAVSTTGVHARGTVHLLTNVLDGAGTDTSVTLTGRSLTLILPELESLETATDAQRDALVNPLARSTPGTLNNQGGGNLNYMLADRLDRSRVEIMTGGTVTFEGGSHTIAQGGQVAVVARKRTFVGEGAVLDVSGVRGVTMDMASNSLLIELIQPYDFRDSAANREAQNIKSKDVWIDVRDLVLLPAGTGGATTDRYYTPGGLIEVGGHLGNVGHRIGEWAASGGTITFASGLANLNITPRDTGELIVQKGAILDISGGSLDYAGGYINTTRFLGSDGRLYLAGQAPANVKLVSIGASAMRRHERWGEAYTEYFDTPFSRALSRRWESGYTVGRDAGVLSLSTPTVVMEGTVLADIVAGDRQTQARPDLPVTVDDTGVLGGTLSARADSYKLAQTVVPLAGGLYVGNSLHSVPSQGNPPATPYGGEVTLAAGTDMTAGMAADAVLPEGLAGNTQLSLDAINAAGLGALRVSGHDVTIEGGVQVANGGSIVVRGQTITANGDITARSGLIAFESVPVCINNCTALVTGITVADGARIDASGVWANLAAGGDRRDLAYLSGGDVLLRSEQGSVRLGQGSLIDVSAGAAVLGDGSVRGAAGGDVLLYAGATPRDGFNELVLGGGVTGYGSQGQTGGTLRMFAGGRAVTIGAPLLAGDALAAGQAAPIDLQTTQDFVLPAGTTLGFDFANQVSRVSGGEMFSNAVDVNFVGLTPAVDWIVPSGVFVYNEDFSEYWGSGQTMPAGIKIGYGSARFQPGMIPSFAGVFPAGVPLANPISIPIPAGTVLQSDLRVSAGATLKKGWVLPVEVTVAKPLALAADFFQKGFGNYLVRAGGDVVIGAGEQVDVFAPGRRVTSDSLALASGTALGEAMQLRTSAMFREDAANGRFAQRAGASLSLVAAGNSGPYTNAYGQAVAAGRAIGEIHLGAGATVRVDDGQKIAFTAADRMLIQGRIEARGGTVHLSAGPVENVNRLETTSAPILYDATRSIWLDAGSSIDVSGRALAGVGADGLRFAHVSKGGTIHVGGLTSMPRGLTSPRALTAAYVVVRDGATLDASGAAAPIDYLDGGLTGRRRSQLLSTDGGTIAFDSQYGIYLDGTMRAAAGGEGALGGTLSIGLTTPILADAGANTDRAVPDYMRRLRSVILDQTGGSGLADTLEYGDCVTGCWAPGQTTAQSLASNEGVGDFVGQAVLGADRITAGGFDSLSLTTDDVILFNGDLKLSLGRDLTLSGTVGNLDTEGKVDLSAAYVNFAGGGAMWGRDITYQDSGVPALVRRPAIGEGSITIRGGLVDLAGIQFGTNGSIGLNGGRQFEFEYAAPKDIEIISQSDIRLTGGTTRSMSNITLTAAQIYPVTGASASIFAGVYSYRLPGNSSVYRTLMDGSTITLKTLEGSTPSAPLSLYGEVTLGAKFINQGGVLRAPLGKINLGIGGNGYVPGPEEAVPGQTGWGQVSVTTSEVNLLPASLTSVSAADLVIPYGGTTDGLTWTLNGASVTAARGGQGVVVIGSLRADAGAVLDLSGGGTPAGAGFIAGRGGSVDILKTAFANVNPAYAGMSDPDAKAYAIVPAYQSSSAPNAIDGHAQPGFGAQIVIPDGVRGLKAGVYTLLPAEYALMKGAYRVEMGGTTAPGAGKITALPDGSIALGAFTKVVNLDRLSSSATDVILTPADVVRTHSQYDETTFEKFLLGVPRAALFNQQPSSLPRDGKTFVLALPTPTEEATRAAFTFNGTGRFAAAAGGLGGTVSVVPGSYADANTYPLEILADGATARPGAAWLYASDLNRVGATAITLGGLVGRSTSGGGSIVPGGGYVGSDALSFDGFGGIIVRDGATLAAPQIFMISRGSSDLIVEAGATLSTLGLGAPAFDSSRGAVTASEASVLAVSNGLLELSAPTTAASTGRIVVEDGASLYSDGTIVFSSLGPVILGERANFGARYLGLSAGAVNIGTSDALAGAASAGVLPGGIVLTQTVLDRLIAGDSSKRAPALERLILSGSQSINFFGSLDLDVRANSSLQLVLNTPALYGQGGAQDVASVSAGTIVWNGMVGGRGSRWNQEPVAQLPGGVMAGGAGTGTGTLSLNAERIVLGYQDGLIAKSDLSLDRLTLGFANVNLNATDRIETNHKSTISIWQSQAAYGQPGAGGNLTLTTPLLTGAATSSVALRAGGAVTIAAPAGSTPGDARPDVPMGGDLRITGASIAADTRIALPSGRLTLTATQGDLTLGDRARIDVAGMATRFQEETRYSWGGDVVLESALGNVRAAASSVIDLSADYNHAGLLKVTALGGTVALDGVIDGAARNGANPADPALRTGGLDVRAGVITDFAGLNTRLTASGVTETRSFIVKQGDLTIGNEVKARHVSIAADGGDLTLSGRIDASGARPGSIRLSARDDLTLASGAVLDAYGTMLQVDSYGAPVEASNRATVELASAAGTLTLASGATIDVSSPDRVNRGRIELNARRMGSGDIAIDAAGAVSITGAASLAVNGFRTYQPAGGIIDQALMDGIHTDSDAFVNAAIGNQALLGRLAGLRAYSDAFHLRPGVELISAPGASLRVSGDLNLAGYRYAGLNPTAQRLPGYADPASAAYGSGEAGALLIRAADDLSINGSITDGFGMPARTPDDNGWVLYPGAQSPTNQLIQDYALPAPVKLATGTTLPQDATLGFDIDVDGFVVNPNFLLGAETVLAVGAVLDRDWTATSAIRLPDGSVIARGATIASGTELPAGSVLEAGTLLPVELSLAPMTWPKGVRLPVTLTLSASAQLQAGAVIPRDSMIALDGLFGLVREPVTLTSSYTMLGDPSAAAVTTIAGGAASQVVLDFDVLIRGDTQLRRGQTIPFGFALNSFGTIYDTGWTTNVPIWASEAAFKDGAAPIYTAGSVVTSMVDAGSYFGAGALIPGQSPGYDGIVFIAPTVVTAGSPFSLFEMDVQLAANVTVPAGTVIPAGVTLEPAGGIKEAMRPTQADGTQGRIWAVAPMLRQGSQSWSMRFVAGADLGSADTRALRAATDLAAAGQSGSLILSDRHHSNPQATTEDGFTASWLDALKRIQVFSVLRTGTGSLDLLAGGDYRQFSLFGVYTAGTPSAALGGSTGDGFNVYDQPRAQLAGSEGLENPYIGENFGGYAGSVADYHAWYPEHGGDLLLAAQGNLTGFQTGESRAYQRISSGSVTNWLWRQGAYGVGEGTDLQLGEDVPTAWWIHFGGYVPNNASYPENRTSTVSQNAPILVGFTGIGTLGGGNLTVSAGGDAGIQQDWGRAPGTTYSETNRALASSQGLNFAVASTGRVTQVNRQAGFVTGGDLMQTGGGDLTIRIGGGWNPAASISDDLAGTVTNLRGDIDILAGSIGRGSEAIYVDNFSFDPRASIDVATVYAGLSGGITLVPGDGMATVNARGHLMLAGVGDPGAITQIANAGTSIRFERPPRTDTAYFWADTNYYGYMPGTPVDSPEYYCGEPGQCDVVMTDVPGGIVRERGQLLRSSFSLWQKDSRINLFSAGGDITPVSSGGTGNAAPRDTRFWYPPILTVTAASGNIRYIAKTCDNQCNGIPPLELSPSPLGQVEFLATGSIISGGRIYYDGVGDFPSTMPVALSGMSATADLLPNPFRPVYGNDIARTPLGAVIPFAVAGNATVGGVGSVAAFQQDTASGDLLQGIKAPALFYAGKDLLSFSFGMTNWVGLTPYYINSGSADIRAGRDIVNLGTLPALGCGNTGPVDCRGTTQIFGDPFKTAGLVVHSDPSDVTLISAGRDIIYSNMSVAGPGNLVVQAGRNVYQADRGRFTSVGPLFDLTPETRNGGAAISVLTGVGAGGPNYAAFAALYLNPANRADPAFPLVHPSNAGKVAHTYDAELKTWLLERYGYAAETPEAALSYFDALKPVERGIFVRQAYYDELKAAGREYNDAEGPRFGSYLRGRNAIATLLPEKDAAGNAISYAGDLTMFGGSGVRTLFGGNVDLLVAGGQTLIGVGGTVPPSTAGVLSMGSGDVDIYSLNSVLLGQSRVFTTFGGDLFIWSAAGDINAGRGAKSTAVYQPPRRVYDEYGAVTLSPPTQNTGAGIATLAPIAEIPPGDVDLVAPLGTIDAGEAGIRVSGDVNLAALQVLNAANIKVQGNATGIPQVATVNVGALTAASAASTAVAVQAAALAGRRAPVRTEVPAIVTVRFVGFGN